MRSDSAGPIGSTALLLTLRTQVLGQDAGGHIGWRVITREAAWLPTETALVICDMWDKHWSRGATERVEAMAPRMNEVVQAARAAGVQVVHAPSDTMDDYAGSPARQRLIDVPPPEPPPLLHPEPFEGPEPPLPIDDSDGGSDTGETPWFKAWSRQHPAIEIDPTRDGISDDGHEMYGFFQQRGIQHMILMGVHTNMCILNRSFGIKQMVRWGVEIALVRDLTDAMYNPARPPYVSHDEGTRLVVAYIEKFWCPTIDSRQLMDALDRLERGG